MLVVVEGGGEEFVKVPSGLVGGVYQYLEFSWEEAKKVGIDTFSELLSTLETIEPTGLHF